LFRERKPLHWDNPTFYDITERRANKGEAKKEVSNNSTGIFSLESESRMVSEFAQKIGGRI
jgi:hypothetical protein